MCSEDTADREFVRHLSEAAHGREESFRWLVGTFSPALALQAQYRVKGPLENRIDPEDLVQESWLTLCDGPLSAMSAEATRWDAHRFLAYMSGIVRFLAIRYRRNLHCSGEAGPDPMSPGTRQMVLEAITSAFTSASQKARRREALRALQEAMKSLDPLSREVFIMRGIENGANHAVARRLDISPGRVSSLYYRAKEKLRIILGGPIPGIPEA